MCIFQLAECCIVSLVLLIYPKFEIATRHVEAGYKIPLFLVDKIGRFYKSTGSSLHVLFGNK